MNKENELKELKEKHFENHLKHLNTKGEMLTKVKKLCNKCKKLDIELADSCFKLGQEKGFEDGRKHSYKHMKILINQCLKATKK